MNIMNKYADVASNIRIAVVPSNQNGLDEKIELYNLCRNAIRYKWEQWYLYWKYDLERMMREHVERMSI